MKPLSAYQRLELRWARAYIKYERDECRGGGGMEDRQLWLKREHWLLAKSAGLQGPRSGGVNTNRLMARSSPRAGALHEKLYFIQTQTPLDNSPCLSVSSSQRTTDGKHLLPSTRLQFPTEHLPSLQVVTISADSTHPLAYDRKHTLRIAKILDE